MLVLRAPMRNIRSIWSFLDEAGLTFLNCIKSALKPLPTALGVLFGSQPILIPIPEAEDDRNAEMERCRTSSDISYHLPRDSGPF